MDENEIYIYHIVYNFSTKESTSGFGSTTMELKKPLDSSSLINELREYILEKEGLRNVVILNWKELKSL